jgi:hypothetical protein
MRYRYLREMQETGLLKMDGKKSKNGRLMVLVHCQGVGPFLTGRVASSRTAANTDFGTLPASGAFLHVCSVVLDLYYPLHEVQGTLQLYTTYVLSLHLYFAVKQSIAGYTYYSFWPASAPRRPPPPVDVNYEISRLSRTFLMAESPPPPGDCPLEHR